MGHAGVGGRRRARARHRSSELRAVRGWRSSRAVSARGCSSSGLGASGTALAVALGAIVVASLVHRLALADDRRHGAADAGAAGRARDLANYAGFFLGGPDSFRVDPEAVSRDSGGSPSWASWRSPSRRSPARRLWSSLVLGGSLLILTILLVSPVFTVFSELVSISQARRLVLFLPLSFALAGAAVLAGRFRWAAVAGALALGVVASVAFPAGEARAGGWPAWVALAGAAVGLVLAAWRRPARAGAERLGRRGGGRSRRSLRDRRRSRSRARGGATVSRSRPGWWRRFARTPRPTTSFCRGPRRRTGSRPRRRSTSSRRPLRTRPTRERRGGASGSPTRRCSSTRRRPRMRAGRSSTSTVSPGSSSTSGARRPPLRESLSGDVEQVYEDGRYVLLRVRPA